MTMFNRLDDDFTYAPPKVEPIHPDEARNQGYIVDTHCYPWFAYKGERFNPTESRECYTDRESKMVRADTRCVAETQFIRNAMASDADKKFVEVVRNLDRGDAARARIERAVAARIQVPAAVQALHFFLTVEMKRVFFNVRQVNWNPKYDPRIDGIIWRPQWTGNPHDPRALEANFEFEGVQLWFVNPGRETHANQDLGILTWTDWFERCHKHIIAWGEEHKYDHEAEAEDFDNLGFDED